MATPDREGKGWLRAIGLLSLTTALSVVQPVTLVAIPFLFLVVGLPGRRAALVLGAALAGLVVVSGSPESGLWALERGWGFVLGGWFVALTMRWPEARLTSRAIGAVAGTYGVIALLLLARPGGWEVVDWAVTTRMSNGVATALEALRLLRGESMLPQALVSAVYRTAQFQARIFPALLGLASASALGIAWWLFMRLRRSQEPAVGDLGGFRFNDQLVWVFIVGVACLLIGADGGVSRAGVNAVVFMGGLYVLRGAGVVIFLSGGVSALGVLLLVFGMLFASPIILTGALAIGLTDTWLDLRARVGAAGA